MTSSASIAYEAVGGSGLVPEEESELGDQQLLDQEGINQRGGERRGDQRDDRELVRPEDHRVHLREVKRLWLQLLEREESDISLVGAGRQRARNTAAESHRTRL